MRAYRETFRRHRVLFCLPPVLCAAVLALLVFSAQKNYEAYASLWVDNGPSGQSSLDNTVNAPSGSEQTLLNELLATKGFDLQVGKGSLLNQYLAGHGASTDRMDARLSDAVAKGVTTSTPGPQIMTVTFTGPTPTVSQSVLQSLIVNVQTAMSYYSHTFGKTARAYFQQQVNAAMQAVSRATAATNAYRRSHPRATTGTDQSYAALIAAQQSATTQLATATTGLNQASSQATGAGSSTLVHVVDPPSYPTAPTSGLTSAMKKVVGGFLGGLLLSVIVIVAMTPSGEDRWDVELSGGERLGRPGQPLPFPGWSSQRRIVIQPKAPTGDSGSDEKRLTPGSARAQRLARAALRRRGAAS